MFTIDQIDPEPTPGRQGRYHYRRVRLDGLRYNGVVRYEPRLDAAGIDVQAHILEFLNRRAARLGEHIVQGELYSPLDVPMKP